MNHRERMARCEHGEKPDDCWVDCSKCGHACHHGDSCSYERWGSDNMDIDVCEVDECLRERGRCEP